MADDSFNGASLTFATVAVGPIRSISFSEVGAKADVTDSDDSAKAYDVGIPDATVTIEVVGGVSVSVGDTGTLTIAWGDIGTATSGTIAQAQVVSIATNGSMDSEITSTVEFCTAAPTA
jgi:hypothetical protein